MPISQGQSVQLYSFILSLNHTLINLRVHQVELLNIIVVAYGHNPTRCMENKTTFVSISKNRAQVGNIV